MTVEYDYAVDAALDVADTDELVARLREHRGGAVRIAGAGTRQHRVPAPRQPVTVLRLAGLRAISRLDPDDLTCSVEAGVRLGDLDRALREHDLALPGIDLGAQPDATVGGTFALGEATPAAPGRPAPRSLLLGLAGVLGEGLRFKSGARVVKSVAGFDLQRLFVGSQGRLFVATLLHLRLRRRSHGSVAFECSGLSREAALERFTTLRRDPRPDAVWLERDATFAVRGAITAAPAHREPWLTAHTLSVIDSLAAAEPTTPLHDREVIAGQIAPSRIGALLDVLPIECPVRVNGTGAFTAVTTPAQADTVLERCATLPARAAIRCGAATRRGHGTPKDAVAQRLEQALTEALDPHGVLR